MTRRKVIAAAAAVAAGPVLAACASSTGAAKSATPQTAQPVETVYFQINWQQSWNKTAIALCQQHTDQNFNSTHKGVRAIPLPWGNAQGVLTQVLAGDKTAPAVVSSCCSDFPVAQPMLAPLDPLLRQYNINSNIWSQGQLVTYQMPDGLYGVPAYTACQPLIYDQGVFDELGLAYPDPAWTYKDAAQIWTQITGDKNGIHRYGTTFQFYPNNFDGSVFLHKGFGGALMDATKTKCLLGEPGSLAAANWIYPLIWEKVLINRGGVSGMNGATAVSRGRVVMYQSAGNMLYEAVTVLGSSVKWDVLPMPAWPVQRGTNVQVDYYGMNKYYPNQELAWELFQFVAAGQETNRFLIQSTLSFPNLSSMWSEWETIVRAAAPITANKHIEYWAEAATQGYGYGHEFFLYEANQALDAMVPYLQQMWNHQMDPNEGYPLIVKAVNNIEAVAAATAKENAALASAASVPANGSYAAPSAKGLVGQPATAAPNLVTSTAAGLTMHGTGAGLGVQVGQADAGTLAAAAETAATATFSCQLSAFTRGNCPYMSQWAAAGLMVRGYLGDNAPMVFIGVTGGAGLVVVTRSAPGAAMQVQLGVAGFPTSAQLTKAGASTTAGNVLKAPVWLRIQRSQTTWTVSSSLDGQTWTAAGKAVKVVMPGVWVGPFATANNVSFGDNGQYVSASFADLQGVKPDRFVQIGAA